MRSEAYVNGLMPLCVLFDTAGTDYRAPADLHCSVLAMVFIVYGLTPPKSVPATKGPLNLEQAARQAAFCFFKSPGHPVRYSSRRVITRDGVFRTRSRRTSTSI